MVLETVRCFLAERGIRDCGLVVAVSGGADSIALLLTLTSLHDQGLEVTCGHVNHHIRGVDADDDEAYVRAFCRTLGVACIVADGTLDPESVRQHGIEAAARHVRTERLQEIRRHAGATFIATAHQKNDQAETVLMRLVTGSGIAGLRGIHPQRDDGFIRPLLEVRRSEVDEFLRERGVTPRVDSMNDDPRYLRTRIRRALRELDPAAIDSLAAVAVEARERWNEIEALLDVVEDAEITASETRFRSLPEDPALRRALLHRHIRRLSSRVREVSAADLIRLASTDTRRVTVTPDLELLRLNGTTILRRTDRMRKKNEAYEVTVSAGEEVSIDAAGVRLQVRRADGSEPASTRRGRIQMFQLPAGAVPHFVVRSRRPGDRLRPLGGPEKKLKDLLIDRKVSLEERDRIPLLVWNDRIVWVAGVEVSDEFKITGSPADRYVAELLG